MEFTSMTWEKLLMTEIDNLSLVKLFILFLMDMHHLDFILDHSFINVNYIYTNCPMYFHTHNSLIKSL